MSITLKLLTTVSQGKRVSSDIIRSKCHSRKSKLNLKFCKASEHKMKAMSKNKDEIRKFGTILRAGELRHLMCMKE
jgi:hypothetical protein